MTASNSFLIEPLAFFVSFESLLSKEFSNHNINWHKTVKMNTRALNEVQKHYTQKQASKCSKYDNSDYNLTHLIDPYDTAKKISKY